jgi:gas vesicle protein
MTRGYKVKTILSFVLGAGVGAVAALLLAPKSGEELRAEIAAEAGDEVNEIRRAGNNLKQKAQKSVEAAQDHLQDAIEAGEEAYARAKKA